MRKYSFVFLLFLSCRSNDGNLIAIRDFEPSLRPWLVRAAATGIVGYDTATHYVRTHATDKELVLLSRSEQPILRAIALEEMMNRPSFDHFKVIMDHLSDTGMIAMDAGEWGFRPMNVSDFLVEERGKWKTAALRAITMDSIVFHHDYLQAAYTAINRVDLNAALYPHVRKMVQRDRDYRYIQDALYALARYKKKEDIPLIKATILKSLGWRMSGGSFEIIKDFPDTAYMEILEEYFPRRFYRSACAEAVSWCQEYIEAAAVYKNDSTAAILKAIAERKPFMPCRNYTNTLGRTLIHAIWDNPCPAYAELRQETLAWKRYYAYSDSVANANPLDVDVGPNLDTVVQPEPVSWW